HAQEQGDQHVADNVGSKQISRDEAARTVKCCLPERQQAGIAEQQVKSEPEQAPYQNAAQQSGPHSQQGPKNWHGAKDDAHHEFKTVPLPDPLTAGGNTACHARRGRLAYRSVQRRGIRRNISLSPAHDRPSTPINPCGLSISMSAMAANSMTSE